MLSICYKYNFMEILADLFLRPETAKTLFFEIREKNSPGPDSSRSYEHNIRAINLPPEGNAGYRVVVVGYER